jgi:uncharacterized membrane protein
MTYSMKNGKLARLPSKLRKVLSQLSQRKVQLWKALRRQPYLALLLVAIFIYGIVFSYFTVLKHNLFQTTGWDLGVFDQALYTTVHYGKFLYYTADLFLSPSGCYFAQHVSPVLFLITPFYAISSSPITLLVLKSFILAFGALPLYLLAKELLESKKAGFMVAIVYLLYVPLQGANWFDFQPQVFLPLLFFSMFYSVAKSKWKLYFLTMILAAMVEEHISILIFLVAVYLLITSKVRPFWQSLKSFNNMNQNLASIITMIFCAIYFIAAGWIKNSFPLNPQFMYRYEALSGFSVLGVQRDIYLFPIYALLNPQRAYYAFIYDFPVKFVYLVFLFAPLLFFSFKSKLILVTVPFLGLFLLSNFNAYYSIGSHYPLYILAIIFVAALIGLKRLQHDAKISILKIMLVVSVLLALCASPLSPLSDPLGKEGLLWYSNASLAPNKNVASLADLVNVIPSNASVLTQNTIFPHVSDRINAYVLPSSDVVNDSDYVRFLINSSEYVLLDLSWQDPHTIFVLNEITRNNSYGAYALARNAVLFKRGFQGEPLFAYYTENEALTYKDFNLAPDSQNVSDPSAVSEKVVMYPQNLTGYFVYGPSNYLLSGSYEVTFTVKAGIHNSSRLGWCDISGNFGNFTVCKRDIFGSELQPDKWTNFTLAFTSTELLTAVEFRVFSCGTADMYVDRVLVKRVSPNATSDFGLRTFDSSDLRLASGYSTEDGFMIFPQNTTSSTFWYGPYVTLPAGKYRVTPLLKVSPLPQNPDEHIVTLSVSANSARYVFAKYELKASDFLSKENASDWQKFTLEFIAKDNLENVEFTGLAPSSNVSISLAYVMVEKLVLTPDTNYELFSLQTGLHVANGQIVSDSSSYTGEAALSRKGLNYGILTYGPYVTLPNGTFTAVFRIKTYETSQNTTILFEVVCQAGTLTLSNMTLNSSEIHDGSWFNVSLPFSLKAYTTDVEFRVSNNGLTNLSVDTVTVLYPSDDT